MTRTDLKLYETIPWPLGDAPVSLIGWIDQEGTIWPYKEAPNNNLPPFKGSLTPLLIPLDD